MFSKVRHNRFRLGLVKPRQCLHMTSDIETLAAGFRVCSEQGMGSFGHKVARVANLVGHLRVSLVDLASVDPAVVLKIVTDDR